MYISKFHVSNYKSYRDSNEVELKPGFNIVTGQNSAGKTALLEALTLDIVSNPHRSLLTSPSLGTALDSTTVVEVTFVISGMELLRLLRQFREQALVFPAPTIGWRFSTGVIYNGTQGDMNRILQEIVQSPALELDFVFSKALSGEQVTIKGSSFMGLYELAGIDGNGNHPGYAVNIDHDQLVATGAYPLTVSNDVRATLFPVLRTKIYRFKAERFTIGEYAFGNKSSLASDARDLPQVLNTLNINPAQLDRFSDVVSNILPQVRRVSVGPNASGNLVELTVWPHDHLTERADLAIPLNESGSGVGQVLAIIYLVLTSHYPQTIIVDEPQSFLHPGAIRKLIAELKKHPQHQYILATHSPTVISASDPATITMVRATDGVSVLEAMNPKDINHQREYLAEIGARLADVFGADKILWVEGPTEEECFPLILGEIAKHSLNDTVIVGIRQVGLLQGRDKKRFLEIYRRLSQAKTLLPPTVAFTFDQECLSEQDKKELVKMSDGLVHFLPRRMYENYLLDARAIVEIMNGIAGFGKAPVAEQELEALFDAKRKEKVGPSGQLRYFCKGTSEESPNWRNNINAALLLEDIFEELSEFRVPYSKTTHSVALTKWLIHHRPDQLQEVADWLANLLSPRNETRA